MPATENKKQIWIAVYQLGSQGKFGLLVLWKHNYSPLGDPGDNFPLSLSLSFSLFLSGIRFRFSSLHLSKDTSRSKLTAQNLEHSTKRIASPDIIQFSPAYRALSFLSNPSLFHICL
jgi:hypothetical protein